ncbi:Non-canonical poly(A) RNA polymerase PAPD5 [Ananas comosus]|uniref:Non-canonical poly(A) RNA polymerase PAPD5 n=1 Tax=Ananas comosus TaxID=4615 RepID=A0A199VH07_ANACO|nr:Non-canonical poly(A) RNA polymerase PAPD5 [Ananas comosus]
MDSPHQLLDSLTAHIALYHSSSSSPSNPNPNPNPSPNPNPRSAILRWFSSLPVCHRQCALTVVDPDFVVVLLQMLSRLRRLGHGFFFLLPDLPSSSSSSSSSSLPSLCFRRSRGLLARAAAADAAELGLARSLLLFSSGEGDGGDRTAVHCPLDALTVSEDFVSDVDRFVEVMDGISGGGFLRGEESGVGAAAWPELAWLKNKGYYSLEAFVANRLEVALRLVWLSGHGGKKPKGGKAAKEKAGTVGVAANAFWRKKGCLDWWLGLDCGHRKKIYDAFLGKATKSLVILLLHCIIHMGFDGMPISRKWRGLQVVQEIARLRCNNNQLESNTLFFTTLASAGTLSDYIYYFHNLEHLLPYQEHGKGLGDCKGHSTKKKSKRKGAKMKASNSSEVQIPMSGSIKKAIPSNTADSILESSELTGPVSLKLYANDSDAMSELGPVDVDEKPTGTKLNNGIPSCPLTRAECCNCSSQFNGLSMVQSDLLYAAPSEETPQASPCFPFTEDNICSNQLIRNNVGLRNLEERVCESGLTHKECDHHGTSIGCEGMDLSLPAVALEGGVVNKEQLLQGLVRNNCSVIQNDGGECYIYDHRNPMGGKSYEWPSITPLNFISTNAQHLPAATDRLHLDVGHEWLTNLDPSFLPPKNPVRNSSNEGGSRILPALPLPLSSDWPPMVRSYSRPSQNFTLCYDSMHNPRMQSSAWAGDIFDTLDLKNTSEFADDSESYWYSEEENENHAFSGRNYNQYFGGGVMYWSPAEYVGSGFSRPPSHSSDDSAWAWHEADITRAIDDMVGVPALSSSYNTNDVASPPATSFCSPFEPSRPPQQSVGYSMAGNDINGKVLNSSSSISDGLEEKVSISVHNSSSSVEGAKGDTLPYSMLRPIIVPSISRRGSRSEFKLTHDHRSPCVPSTRRDIPRMKRPPSPVVLCVPRVPRPPPPSPVGESRKRGFQVVRSGSSSPRHWGVRTLCSDEKKSDRTQVCLDGPEVVWPSWGNKGLPPATMVPSIQGPVLQDHLIKISQLARDQEHVAAENLTRKPYINWAIKRVARCLQVLWPRSRTNIFGSNATGLALPTSDVDLVVSLPPVRNLEPIKEAGILEGRNGIKETCLQHAARYLANQEWVRGDSLKTIENTAIPVIMLVAEVPCDINLCNENSSVVDASQDHSITIAGEQGSVPHSDSSCPESSSWPMYSKMRKDDAADVKCIRLDISFKSPSHTGLRTSELVRDLTQQFPASMPLALVLKKFLADRSLDHSYSGGLSSYCLILLITRFLQHEHHVGQPTNQQNLGSLLMDFFYFFGNVFDPRQMRISIQGTGLYMTRERGLSIDPIHIDDPLYSDNNVGRNCFRIHQCIKAFADAYSVLENELTQFSGDHTPTSASSFSLLRKIIPSIDHDG